MTYSAFLERRAQLGNQHGFDPIWMPDFLFGFQKALVDWSVRKGRAAIFADCGMGKTPMQLVWSENIVRKTNGRVLILTPLAVGHQTLAEAAKFGIEAHRSHKGELHAGINIANYERLKFFQPSDFVGCVCDESSILKSFDGVTKAEVTEFMKKLPYRLLCTATAAPNDYIELGTSSEALGELGYTDMLMRFFKNDQNTVKASRRELLSEAGKWRFKGHAEIPFWKWVCSWARACRRPSDLGFDDDGFILPPLRQTQHEVIADKLAEGMLFPLPAIGLKEEREERRRTIDERCAMVARLVNGTGKPALVWCHLNQEGDLLAKSIPDAQQVSGDDSEETKEDRFLGFSSGKIRVLVTKPKIGAWGLNFQHCNHVTFFPSHSFEQYYQGVRRCWRFGQKNPVQVDIVTTEGEKNVMQNLQRKATGADRMFSHLVSLMNESLSLARSSDFPKTESLPSWL